MSSAQATPELNRSTPSWPRRYARQRARDAVRLAHEARPAPQHLHGEPAALADGQGQRALQRDAGVLLHEGDRVPARADRRPEQDEPAAVHAVPGLALKARGHAGQGGPARQEPLGAQERERDAQESPDARVRPFEGPREQPHRPQRAVQRAQQAQQGDASEDQFQQPRGQLARRGAADGAGTVLQSPGGTGDGAQPLRRGDRAVAGGATGAHGTARADRRQVRR